MCRFYWKGKNGRKRFTVLFENVYGIFSLLRNFLACIRKNESYQNPEPTQPKWFPQVEFWGKGLV